MIRLLALVALTTAAPIAAQSRPHDAARPVSHERESYGSLRYGPLAHYDSLTERVDRKAAAADRYKRDTPEMARWKHRQHIEEPMDDDDGEE